MASMRRIVFPVKGFAQIASWTVRLFDCFSIVFLLILLGVNGVYPLYMELNINKLRRPQGASCEGPTIRTVLCYTQ